MRRGLGDARTGSGDGRTGVGGLEPASGSRGTRAGWSPAPPCCRCGVERCRTPCVGTGSSRPNRRGDDGAGRRRVVARDTPRTRSAHKVHDLGDLFRHQVQDGVTLGGLEMAKLGVQLGGPVGQRRRHLQESLRRDHGCVRRWSRWEFLAHPGWRRAACDRRVDRHPGPASQLPRLVATGSERKTTSLSLPSPGSRVLDRAREAALSTPGPVRGRGRAPRRRRGRPRRTWRRAGPRRRRRRPRRTAR